jgi:N-acetylmuramoyl-L-alanine amidase
MCSNSIKHVVLLRYEGARGRFLPYRATIIEFAIVCGAIFFATGLSGAADRKGAAKPSADEFPAATDIRVGGDEKETRFVIDFTRKVDMRAFTLADPYRVVVDLPQVTFRLPAGLGEKGRGLVKAFRYGLVMQGGSRLVLDLSAPARIDKSFALDAAGSQPARIVLDLVAVDRPTFLRSLAVQDPVPPPGRKQEREPLKSGDPRPLIVIDPGHGGIDNGTRAASGEVEKTIVLDLGLLLRDQLEKTGKYRVAMTRTDDTFVALGERVRIARSRQASLFLSIHADALARGDGDAQGATVYTVSDTASDAEAARLAEAENKADIIAGIDLTREPDDLAEILIDLAQRETKVFSVHFAKALIGQLKPVARLHKNPLRSAGFKVLKSPDVPSVLLELGYVSSKQDLKLLTSGAWRQRVANAAVQAVEAYFATRIAGGGSGGPH